MQKMIAQEKIITRIVKQRVAETFRELLQDPDAGLELQEWVKKRLAKKPGKTISLGALRKKYSL